MAESDLSLIETRVLLNELQRRFDAMIFAGIRWRTCHGDVDHFEVTHHKSGLPHTCIGLAREVEAIIMHELQMQNPTMDNSEK